MPDFPLVYEQVYDKKGRPKPEYAAEVERWRSFVASPREGSEDARGPKPIGAALARVLTDIERAP